MRFAGTLKRQRDEAKAAWDAWAAVPGRNPDLVMFAERWTALMEERAQYGQERVVITASRTFTMAGGGRWTAPEITSLIEALLRSWYYRHGLRSWAIDNNYIPR